MADSRRGTGRGSRNLSRVSAKTTSGSRKKGSGRSNSKQKLTVLPDLDNDTPRLMLKRVIQTQPQVTPLAPRVSKHEETEEAPSELPPKRVSSMGEMQLPDLLLEETSTTSFHMSKKRRKLSISEFERAVDKRLPQNQDRIMLDSTALARSLRISLGALIPPDTVEKRGLLRRPKSRRAIDMEAFEGGVEQNMLKRKAEDYLVESQLISGNQTAMLTTDAVLMLSNTQLFVQPQMDEQNRNHLSALEPQLSHSKTPAQTSKISDEAQQKEGVVGTKNGSSSSYSSEDLNLDHEHVDRMTSVPPKTPADQQEDQQAPCQQSHPVEQLSVSEEVVIGTVNRWSNSLSSRSSSKYFGFPSALKPKRDFIKFMREVVSQVIEDLDVSDSEEELAKAVKGVEQEEMSREAAEHHGNAEYFGDLEKKPTKSGESQITAAQDTRVETEMALFSSEEEEIAEDEVEQQGSPKAERQVTSGVEAKSLGGQSIAFSSSKKSGMKPLTEADQEADELEDKPMLELDDLEEEPAEDEAEHPETEEVSMKTPLFVSAAASKPLLSTPRPAKPATPKSALQPPQAKPVPKSSGPSRRKTHEPGIASSLIKKIFSHYVKMPVSRDAFRVVEKCSQRYFKQLCDDLEAYTKHAGRKTVEMADLEVLMKRQGLVTEKMPMHVLIERYFPMEYRKLLIPVAVSGNKVIPCK